ncbi:MULTISPECIES: phycobilisome linker polypeptide [unclassified Coleofasciculus]|uniref:phycobilisome linker polypeptide n=1 Tax=unclassified Coleofasciculus TaxID=2692782 RepID=UPI001880CC48|nr:MULTISPECIES: phycobilisome linker polypeptide [unclassified Coleofasciculus]MBE9126423.1 phycobilisome linker polypeptide [Coleofasciculus sp. LEGE 07081]MBE9148025.1 phycobilisome linker polypeptide [Coleofasciculus sp. LEGE 07092]
MTSLSAARRLGISAVAESPRVELRPHWTEDDLKVVIRAAYRQVLGNDSFMECDRLISAESLLRQGEITVREFVRALGQSELYRRKFFFSNPQNRFIELNYKHFLGRAPYDQSEIAYHTDLYNQQGYEAEINSYIDSVEYQENFGDSVVPYHIGFETQRSQKAVGYPRLFQLYGGVGSSDRTQPTGNRARLIREVARNSASPIYADQKGQVIPGIAGGSRQQIYRLRVIQAAPGGRARVRQSNMEYLVPYEQLSRKLQLINRMGGKVTSITPA